jgi:hypothetical protein
LEFLRCRVGRLYTWGQPNTTDIAEYKYKGNAL